MLVEIRDKHIKDGSVSETGCPVALGLNEATGKIWFVYRTYVREIGELHRFELPEAVKAKISLYDTGQGMKPFSFEIDLKPPPEKGYRATHAKKEVE